MIPVTEAERRVGEQVTDHRDELSEPLRQAGREVRAELAQSLQTAADDLKATANDAASHTMHQVTESGHAAIQSLNDQPSDR